MGAAEATRQSDNITQPVAGYVMAIVLDATSRAYNLSSIALQFFPGLTTNGKESIYLTLRAEDADAYYVFSSATGTVDETAAMAAAGTPAFTANACDVIPAGGRDDVRWNRAQYPWLLVKGSAAGVLRIRASSEPSIGSIKTTP
jgi:hypothetical protein